MNIVSNLNFVCESVSLQNSVIQSKKYIQEDHLVRENKSRIGNEDLEALEPRLRI